MKKPKPKRVDGADWLLDEVKNKKLSREGRGELSVDLAFAACGAIQKAVANAAARGGEFNLNDLMRAHKFATEAIRNRWPNRRDVRRRRVAFAGRNDPRGEAGERLAL